MPSIQTHIIINAPPASVRRVFFDYESYKDWNPFFVNWRKSTHQQTAQLHVGDELQIEMKLKGMNHTSTMYPTVLQVDEDKLVWQGCLISSWIFYGVHTFEIEPLDDGGARTVFGQSEEFGGLLVYVLQVLGVFRKTEESFKLFNEALKDRVENLDAPSAVHAQESK
ncbi:uncharacterized protein LODBEIA_P51260 [Lodderomyces beijingensis]|uniref:Coenzyme Q-binding protein COQ10 START domain-containing protein n=1 Tax=Lodderomyces beijingensis TaxID=1775926 RepID=A0ABP0ZS09_9ASCO